MNKSRGVSLITLVITIVVIIIIAGISIYNGISNNIDDTINTMDYNEIFEVSEAVAQRALFNKISSKKYLLVGDNSNDTTVTMEIISGEKEIEVKKVFRASDGWYLVDSSDSKELNIDNVRRKYVVNYETNEVVSLEPIYYEGKKYYTANDLRGAISGGDIIIATNSYNEQKGVNEPYLVSGMIPVKLVGNDWVVTNAEDPEWYDYSSNSTDSSKGNLWANVMLYDEIELAGMTNAQVRNASLNEIEGRIVKKSGSMYVWLPRYSRGTKDGKTQIVYSRLLKDYFENEDSTDNVLKAFISNNVRLTGIWISKYDAGYIEN